MSVSAGGKDHKSRLGRGLSSLLAEPVPVTPVREPATSSAGSSAQSGLAPRPSGSAGVSAPSSAIEINVAPAKPVDAVQLIELERLSPSPYQPRREISAQALAELAASIRTAGVMQPILARAARGTDVATGGLEIIAGERRWRAAGEAGLTHVPVLVRTLTDQEAAEWALVENLQREDLSAMDRSVALRRLSSDFGLSHGAIAERVGLDRSSVTNLIRLGELEPEIQALMNSGALSAGHGKALLAVAGGAARVELAKRAAALGLSVRSLEKMAENKASKQGPRTSRGSVKTPAVQDMERQLREHLGTDVTIEARGDGTRGAITIAFYSLDHFQSLASAMGLPGRM